MLDSLIVGLEMIVRDCTTLGDRGGDACRGSRNSTRTPTRAAHRHPTVGLDGWTATYIWQQGVAETGEVFVENWQVSPTATGWNRVTFDLVLVGGVGATCASSSPSKEHHSDDPFDVSLTDTANGSGAASFKLEETTTPKCQASQSTTSRRSRSTESPDVLVVIESINRDRHRRR